MLNTQLDLFNGGASALGTRNESFRKVLGKQSQRKRQILDRLEAAGRNGLTRFQVSQAVRTQQSSICGAVLDLIHSGEIIETTARRENQAGGSGLVLIHSRYAEGFHHG